MVSVMQKIIYNGLKSNIYYYDLRIKILKSLMMTILDRDESFTLNIYIHNFINFQSSKCDFHLSNIYHINYKLNSNTKIHTHIDLPI